MAIRLIRLEGDSSEISRLAYLDVRFAFRVPPDALLVGGPLSGGDVELPTPERGNVLIPHRRTTHGKARVVNLSYRKRMRGGCILRRPCFRILGSKNAIELRQAHLFRPWVSGNVTYG